LGQLPASAAGPTSRALDLVFMLDTICLDETLKERRRFIKTVIQEVAGELQTAETLRVCVIPYGPHENLAPDAQPEAGHLPTAPLTSDLGLIYRFLREQEAHRGKGFEAAYEEALYALHTLEWERASQRILVTVGHRPPRPCKPWLQRAKDPFDCYYQESCERNLDWRFLLTGMRCALRLHSIAVVCQSTWLSKTSLVYAERYAKFCWNEIGYTMSLKFSPNPLAAKQLARALLGLA
jgi:hypothetical protein